jgi:long-chain acyl-CoA synthetase
VSPEAAAHALRDGAADCGDGLMIGPRDEACVPEPDGAEAVAALVYTTGTTGKPKGVMLSHRSLLFVAAVSSRLRGLAPTDRAWGVLPFSHVYGLTSVLLGTLSAGACLRLAPRFTPEEMLAAIHATRPHHRAGRAGDVCAPAERCRTCPRRRWHRACASPTPAARRSTPPSSAACRGLLGVPLHNGYGLTEAAPTVSQTRLDAPRSDTSVGLPIPGVEVRLVGREGPGRR